VSWVDICLLANVRRTLSRGPAALRLAALALEPEGRGDSGTPPSFSHDD